MQLPQQTLRQHPVHLLPFTGSPHILKSLANSTEFLYNESNRIRIVEHAVAAGHNGTPTQADSVLPGCIWEAVGFRFFGSCSIRPGTFRKGSFGKALTEPEALSGIGSGFGSDRIQLHLQKGDVRWQ